MHRKTFLATCAVALGLAAAGCATRPDVRTDTSPATDLKSYRTFAFYDRPATDGTRYSTILTQRLKSATRVQMERQGYTYSEQAPDLLVNFAARVVEKQELHAAGRVGLRTGTIATDAFREGLLRIDVVDARRQVLAWQGVAEGRLTEEAVRSPGPTVEMAVAEIFAKFPG